MFPDCIDATNFRYIKVDDKYVISLMFKSLPDKIYFLEIFNSINKNIEYDMSVYIEKLDTTQVINTLTYNITNMQSEINTMNKYQKNIDIINRSSQDAQNIRKKIQLENQELYSISIILSFYSNDLFQLQRSISSFKAKLYSKRINSDITNFRHLDFFQSNLPLNLKNELMHKIYITTDALANIFPFYTQNLMDENGITFGYNAKDNKLCYVDIFSKKYENSNMCIFGSSGSGKSFFTKLLICRNYFQGKRQIILDIEDEYSILCKKLNGSNITQNSYFNILQILEQDVKENGFLDAKIERIIGYISIICNIESIDVETLKKELKKLYLKFNITNEASSVMCFQTDNMISLDSKILPKEKFPTLVDLKNYTEDKKIKQFLNSNINGVLEFFSQTTTFDIDKDLYVISVNKLQHASKILWIILNGILNRYIGDRETIIYIDEVWKYAREKQLLSSILDMYKTIRKRRASIVTITQDITDLFKYEKGMYAKGILNNSSFKMIFKTEYKDEKIFNKLIDVEEELSTLKKGEAYLLIGKNKLAIKVQANKFEGDIIDENDNSYK